ncbi:MAG TPA: hypothetical protein VFD14_02650, partial [Clostridia bacterium]|nr:hypothetical protein [Clostridia bacterium]
KPSRPRAEKGMIGSLPYLPPVAGFLMASQVVRDLSLPSTGFDLPLNQADEGKEEESSQVDQDNDWA